jgi:hypothetical protein
MECEEPVEARVTYVLLTKYYSGNQIKKNEMEGACGTYGGQEGCMQGFGGKI